MSRIIVWTALLAVVLIGVSAIAQEDALDAGAILSRVNSVWRGDSFHGVIGLDISLDGQTKSYKLEVWTLGQEQTLIRVLEPETDLNSGYLQLATTFGTTRRPSAPSSCRQWHSAMPCSEQGLHWTTCPAGRCPMTTTPRPSLRKPATS